jgi:hypothetical protein
METKITKKEYEAAYVQAEAAQAVMNAYHRQRINEFEVRWERFEKGESFVDSDLEYAATTRCEKCGAGLAHPKDCGPGHQWTCSAVLKGEGTDGGHVAYPFAAYEISSESQRDGTTRPQPPAA